MQEFCLERDTAFVYGTVRALVHLVLLARQTLDFNLRLHGID